ncbi:uncharacterized protein LOC116264658 isoform X2 [Nymphaea colorata]|uniref:uncharacterized protein LOC116264658 isoform X2 n=1 Tax=Nymphaea colorata TaxID=210225 RepID=UPI00129D4DC5|nr:uncharacterized protein LOC116264658 isoform X2 [Nymphaea colorata]
MGDWRGSREFPGRKPSSSKQRCSWKPTVPAWEKEFCATVCLIPWWKVCEAKKIMPLYENVVQWNDSAGEEAFSNAKKRFWAKINGLPCDVSLPDPDIYIDEIDWDSIDDVDPELLLALEQQEPIVAEKSKGDSLNSEQPGSTGNNWENFVVFSCHQGNNLFPCSGWGDGDDWARGVNNCTAESNRWKDDFKNNGQATQVRNSWDSVDFAPGNKDNVPIPSSGWDDASPHNWPECSWGNDYVSSWKCHDWNHGLTQFSSYDPAEQGKRNWAVTNGSGRKREGGGRYGSRYKRYQSSPGEIFPATTEDWWNCGGRKRTDHFTHERALVGK